MKIKFCGAAQTVTGSCHLITLEDGFQILLDAGLYQGKKEKFLKYNSKWLFEPSQIDCMILSHAHIDHCGRIPKLVKDGFKGTIYCTKATRDLAAIMLMDSAKIQQKDAEFGNKQNKKKGIDQVEVPLYTEFDAEACFKSFHGVNYDQDIKINDQVSFILKDSGHIFGSASVTLKINQADGSSKNIGFTGDIGRWDRPILKDPVPLENLDYLICESTYGGVKHHDRPQSQKQLLDIVKETCVDRGGKLIIPAFSVGRTQELVYMLDHLESSGQLPKIPVFVDSPMAINATEVFKIHPECFDQEISDYMKVDPNPFGFNNLNYVRRSYQSKKLNTMEGPAIIISASGMMNSGRIRHHLLNHIEDDRNTLLIVGYCAPHTTGARLRDGAKQIHIFGMKRDVNAKVIIVDSYSGHGDQWEMIEYLNRLDKNRLKGVYLVHGEIDRQLKFKEALSNEGFTNINIPEFKEEYHIEG